MEFEKLVPYLKDPLVLIGFLLLLAFSFSRYLIKRGIIGPLPETLSYKILRLILLYGFIIALLIIILGFALRYKELANKRLTEAEIISNKRLTEAEIISMVNDALKDTPGLSGEKKREILVLILEGHRNGTLSEEQIERILEEIRKRVPQNGGIPVKPGSFQGPMDSDKIEPKSNYPTIVIPNAVANSLPQPTQPADSRTGGANEMRELPSKSGPSKVEIRSPIVVLIQSTSTLLISCEAHQVNQRFICLDDAVEQVKNHLGEHIEIIGYGKTEPGTGEEIAFKFRRQLIDAVVHRGKINESRFHAFYGGSETNRKQIIVYADSFRLITCGGELVDETFRCLPDAVELVKRHLGKDIRIVGYAEDPAVGKIIADKFRQQLINELKREIPIKADVDESLFKAVDGGVIGQAKIEIYAH